MATKLSGPIRKSMTQQFKIAASTSEGRIHIVPSEGKWAIKVEGVKRARSVKSSRRSAMTYAKSLKASHKIIVHREDGTIQMNIEK